MMRTGDILKSPFGGWIGYVGIGAIALGCTDATLSPDADGPAVEATSLAQTAMAPAPSSEAVAAASSCAPVPALAWQPCGEAYPGVECATARVPLDYDQPRGASTTIALARVLAADKSKRIGSVFVNPGGPGGSGVGLILRGFGDYLGSMLAGHFDIVGFDPRGVGASEPLICFDSNDELSELLSLVPSFPYRPMQELPFFNLYRSIAERCFERRARILPHMSTANVARDLDLLRQAVGDKAITYLGFSYGSMLGTTYANLFPSKIRALVIDGVIDPQLWVAGRQIDADRVATGQEFAEFLRLCDEADTDCALSGPDGAGARFYSLAAALRHAPIVFGDGTTYGYDHLIGDAIFAMYEPEQWGGENGYGAFFAYLADAVLENADAARQVLVVRSAIKARRERESPRREPYDNSAEGFYGTMCADAEFPRFFHDWQMIGDWAERGSIFGAYWWWSNTGCADWPMSQDRYAGPFTAHTSAPVLIIGNYFDGVTDYNSAVRTSKLLPNSRLLSYAGWGHTAFGRSDCVTQHTLAYLAQGRLPPEGTVCPANPNPFVPEPAARLADAKAAPMIGLPPSWLGQRR